MTLKLAARALYTKCNFVCPFVLCDILPHYSTLLILHGVQIASRAEEEERLALLEEEARRAKLAADMSETGMSSQERDKINKLVEEVGAFK